MENKGAYPSSATPALPPPYDPADATTGQYGQPYEHQPLAYGHPTQPGYGATQQQQPQVVVVGVVQSVRRVVSVRPQQPRPTVQDDPYVCHVIFSCIVIWCCCNWLFGLIAFFLAG